MAKYEKSFKGKFNELLNHLDEGIINGSVSASYEDGSDLSIGDIKLATRVYERYSAMGSNRVSLNITLLGHGEELFISAITSGGSQAVFFKINRIGEDAFLEKCIDLVGDYISKY